MALSFDSALGIHEAALKVRTKRAEVLANNLANVETPGFKARDIDFEGVLKAHMKQPGQGMAMQPSQGGNDQAVSHINHIPLNATFNSFDSKDIEVQFRGAIQGSEDGNTVDAHSEHARFMENAMDFQTSFTLLNKKFMGISKALKGD